MSLLQLGGTVKELHWGTLAIELVILIVGITVGLQVSEWENRRNDRQLEREYLERLLRSKELRIALANLYQSYQQTIRITQMRNLLRSQSFPVLARQIKPNSDNKVTWDEESVQQNKKEIYVALTVIQQNQIF